MFTHTKKLRHPAKPDRPDPLFAKDAGNFRGTIRGNIRRHAIFVPRMEYTGQ